MRVRDLLRALGALLFTVLFVAGVPALLVTWVGWPLPTSLPSVEALRVGLTRRGVDPAVLRNALAIVVWVAWAQLVVALAVEVVAAVRGRAAARAPVLPALQTTAAQLVAAVALVASSLGPLRPSLVAAGSPPVASAVVEEPKAPPTTQELREQPRTPTADFPTHRVERFDTLWGIAERILGDGSRWREIRDLNVGRRMPDGTVMGPATERIDAGWTLVLPAEAVVEEEEETTDEVRVRPGDHFWEIARRTLEEAWGRRPSTEEVAPYWHRLVEANRDRLLPPHDPDLIYPDQVFELPAVPEDPAAEARGEAAPPLGDGEAFADEPAEAPGSVPDAAARASAPEKASGLGSPRASTVSEGPGQQGVDSARPETAEPELEEVGEERASEDERGEPRLPLLPAAAALAGLGITAAGLVAVLDRLREFQLRRRRPGTMPTPPPEEARVVERTLRAAAAPEALEFCDLALRALARQLAGRPGPLPDIIGASLDPDRLQVLLATPHADPPPGWQALDGGVAWALPTDADPEALGRLAARTVRPCPALCSVGHRRQSQLLLDLERLGATQVTGDPADVLATCYTMAAELATSPLADYLEVILVGFGDDLESLERVRVVKDYEGVADWVGHKAEAVAARPGVSALEGRLEGPGADLWDPIVVFDPSTVPPEGADHLLSAAAAQGGVAAVVGYSTGGEWRLEVARGRLRVEPLGYTLERRNLTPTEREGVGALLGAAKDLQGVPWDPEDLVRLLAGSGTTEVAEGDLRAEEPDGGFLPVKVAEGQGRRAAGDGQVGSSDQVAETLEEPEPVEDDGSGDEESSVEPEAAEEVDAEPQSAVAESPRTLELRVLGSVRLDGFEGSFASLRSLELLAYLVLHRRGAEADTVMEALWPGEPPDNPRLQRVASRTRMPLGKSRSDDLYFPHVGGKGIYRISPEIGCDLERFIELRREADRASGLEEAAHLRAALELVEGTPFTSVGDGYEWARAEGIVSHAMVAVDEAAHRLAEWSLSAGDPAQAAWAARKGLLANRACEVCYRNLMRAAVAEGNQTALDAAFAQLLAVVEADDVTDAVGVLEPETVELYEKHHWWGGPKSS